MMTGQALTLERKTFGEIVAVPGRVEKREKGDKYVEYMLERLSEAKSVLQKAAPEIYKDLPLNMTLVLGEDSNGFAIRVPWNGEYQIVITRSVSERGNPDDSNYDDQLVSTSFGGGEVFPRRIVDTVRLMHELGHVVYSEAVPVASVDESYLSSVDVAINEGFAQYLGLRGVRYMFEHAMEFELTDQEVAYLHFNFDKRKEGVTMHRLAAHYVEGAYVIDQIVKWGDGAIKKVWQRLDGEKMAAKKGSKELFTRLRDPKQLLKEFGKTTEVGVENEKEKV